MEKILAVCGLDCAQCGAYIAAKTNDNALRIKTAAEWSKAHNFAFTPDMINCHGCLATDGVQVGYCSQCEMRACGISKGVKTCKECTEYPCKMISDFQAACPEAAANFRD